MSSDYGYINARIRAMKSFILKEEDYLAALRQRSLDEFLSFLSSLAGYTNDLRRGLWEVEAGLKLNLCRIFRKIVNFSEGEPKQLILILLTPWDIYNLKTIIRGIISFQDKDKIIQTLMPAGRWEINFLTELCKMKDLKMLAQTLVVSSKDELEKEWAGLIRDYAQDLPLELLENSLQEAYFRKAQETLDKGDANARIVRDYLTLEIDFLNIVLVFKKITQANISINFIKGGRISEAGLKKLITLRSVDDALNNFAQSPYPWLSQEGLNIYKRTQRLSSLERLLKNKLLSFCSDLYIRGDPLSMSIPLAFINFKENEVSNLRLIGKAIQFGVSEDLIRGEIIFAG